MCAYRVLIGIPAYNEEDSLRPLLQRIDQLEASHRVDLQVLFVNDGSSDKTAAILAEAKASRPFLTVATHRENQGLGAAINTILTYALEHLGDEDILVTMDGDNTHDPIYVPEIVEMLKLQGLDFVVASRFVKGGKEVGLKAYRKLLSRGASFFFRFFFYIPNVQDYSSGYRAYSMAFLRKAVNHWGRLVTANGFECMAEIMANTPLVRSNTRIQRCE